MIENTNPITEQEYQEFATELKGISSTEEVIDNLIQRRENLLSGGVNCIPLPFERFRSEVPGIEQGQYIVVSANQKVNAFVV